MGGEGRQVIGVAYCAYSLEVIQIHAKKRSTLEVIQARISVHMGKGFIDAPLLPLRETMKEIVPSRPSSLVAENKDETRTTHRA